MEYDLDCCLVCWTCTTIWNSCFPFLISSCYCHFLLSFSDLLLFLLNFVLPPLLFFDFLSFLDLSDFSDLLLILLFKLFLSLSSSFDFFLSLPDLLSPLVEFLLLPFLDLLFLFFFMHSLYHSHLSHPNWISILMNPSTCFCLFWILMLMNPLICAYSCPISIEFLCWIYYHDYSSCWRYLLMNPFLTYYWKMILSCRSSLPTSFSKILTFHPFWTNVDWKDWIDL